MTPAASFFPSMRYFIAQNSTSELPFGSHREEKKPPPWFLPYAAAPTKSSGSRASWYGPEPPCAFHELFIPLCDAQLFAELHISTAVRRVTWPVISEPSSPSRFALGKFARSFSISQYFSHRKPRPKSYFDRTPASSTLFRPWRHRPELCSRPASPLPSVD